MSAVAEAVADVAATVAATATDTDDVTLARRPRVPRLASSSPSSVVALVEDVVLPLLSRHARGVFRVG